MALPDGTYIITNARSKTRAAAFDANDYSDVKATLGKIEKEAGIKWIVEHQGNSRYTVQNARYETYVGAKYQPKSNDEVQCSRDYSRYLWRIVEKTDHEGVAYIIMKGQPELCWSLDDEEIGTGVKLTKCSNETSKLWRFELSKSEDDERKPIGSECHGTGPVSSVRWPSMAEHLLFGTAMELFLSSKLKPVDMNPWNRPTCLPNTRTDVIQSVKKWADDTSDDHKSVLWLHGMAGTGKSTLWTTLVQEMRELGRLGASFFFDRDTPAMGPDVLVRTLAYQLGLFNNQIGEKLTEVLRCHSIGQMPLDVQFAKLLSADVLASIKWPSGPVVLAIDALDECGTERDLTQLLKTLSKAFSALPPFLRILITSRKERDIEVAFGSHTAVYPYYLDTDSSTVKLDITQFVRHELTDIRMTNKYFSFESGWPSDNQIQELGERAGGLFIWASTACSHIKKSQDPSQRLNDLITTQPSEGTSSPHSHLDGLYKTCLERAGNWTDPLFRSDCREIFGAIVCARTPLTGDTVDSLLNLGRKCLHSISHFGSVFSWDGTGPIRVHPSFHDYLVTRSRDQEWFVDLEEHNEKLATHCIALLDNGESLKENICGLTLRHSVQSAFLQDAVSYACRFWVDHVCLISHNPNKIMARIYSFLSRHLLHWMEALAILKSHNITIRSLEELLSWIQKWQPLYGDLCQLVYDGHRFAQYFAHTIEEHPLLIYKAALPFTPSETTVYRNFHRNSLPKVVCGVPPYWNPQLQLITGHDDYVRSIAFSPDGTKIVSGSFDKTIRVWDASTGTPVLPPLLGHDDCVWAVAFSPDGTKIISGSKDKTIRIWDANTGNQTRGPLHGHDECVESVAFSPDGKKIASGSADKTVRVWDASTDWKTLLTLRGHDQQIVSVAWSPDGTKIISGSTDKTICIWDATTGAKTVLQGHSGFVISVAFSPDGTKLISGSEDKTIRIWDAKTGCQAHSPIQLNDAVLSVAFSSDGTRIISGSTDNTIRLWDAATGKETHPPLLGHRRNIFSIGFSPDGTKIISGSYDKTIRIWDANASFETDSALRGHEWPVFSLAFSHDQSKFASGSNDKTIRVWNASTGIETLPPLRGHDDTVISLSFSLDDSKIVSGSNDKTVRIWDANTGVAILPPLKGHTFRVTCVTFSDDGKRIASGSDFLDASIRVWDASNGDPLCCLEGHTETVQSVAFSPDGAKIVSGSLGSSDADKTIRVWDATDGSEILLIRPGDDKIACPVWFEPDGRIYATLDSHTIHAFEPDGQSIGAVAYTPPSGKPIISLDGNNWFIDQDGSFLGKLPTELASRYWNGRGSRWVGWTMENKLILLQFPVADSNQ